MKNAKVNYKEEKKRVIVYVDGFNFYYGLKSKRWKSFYWLDIVGFFESHLKPYQELVELVYFSAKPTGTQQRHRQGLLFQANKLNPKFKLVLGKYLEKEITCRSCGSIIHSHEEKETDVRIATTILSDSYKKRCDIAIIVSADSDLVPPVEMIREFNPSQKVFVYFPPNRRSSNLASISDGTKSLDGSYSIFQRFVLPDIVVLESGYQIQRPENWR